MIFLAYSTFYILGQVMAMQVPFVGFQPVKTSEHMAAAGVFGLLQVFINYTITFFFKARFLCFNFHFATSFF